MAYPRPAFSGTKQTNHATIGFDQQAQVSQGVRRSLLALVGRKQAVVRDQLFPQKPPGDRLGLLWPTHGQRSQQQSKQITLQSVMINKPKFLKAFAAPCWLSSEESRPWSEISFSLRNLPVRALYFRLATWVQPSHPASPRPSSVPGANLVLAHRLLSSLPLSAAVLYCTVV